MTEAPHWQPPEPDRELSLEERLAPFTHDVIGIMEEQLGMTVEQTPFPEGLNFTSILKKNPQTAQLRLQLNTSLLKGAATFNVPFEALCHTITGNQDVLDVIYGLPTTTPPLGAPPDFADYAINNYYLMEDFLTGMEESDKELLEERIRFRSFPEWQQHVSPAIDRLIEVCNKDDLAPLKLHLQAEITKGRSFWLDREQTPNPNTQ